MGSSVSGVPYFIPEHRSFAEVTRLSEDTKKPCIEETLKEINNLINNQTFLVQDPYKGEPVTLCLDFYKSKVQSDGSLYKLKLRVVVREDLYNK